MKARLVLLVLGLAVGLTAACVPIPYKPSHAVDDAESVLAPEVLVDALQSDDEVLRSASKRIRSRDADIEIVPRDVLVPAVLPDDALPLAELLSAERRLQLQTVAESSYVVLIAQAAESDGHSVGGFIPLLGAGGESSTLSRAAAVIDLASGQPLRQLQSSARGRGGGAMFGFYGLFIVPLTDSAVYDGIADGVVQAIREHHGPGKVRIALLYIASSGPTWCPPGAPCELEQAGGSTTAEPSAEVRPDP